jgi:hypothetical protein
MPDGVTAAHSFLEILEDGPDPIKIRFVAVHHNSESKNIVAGEARKSVCCQMLPFG